MCISLRTAGTIILVISRGYSVKEVDDPIIRLMENNFWLSPNQARSSWTSSPHVSVRGHDLSAMQRPDHPVPNALRPPGTGWKKITMAWRQDLLNLADTPHRFVLDQLVRSTNPMSRARFGAQLQYLP